MLARPLSVQPCAAGRCCALRSRRAHRLPIRCASAPPDMQPALIDEAKQSPGAYFVATNHFRVKPEQAQAFENRWKSRDTHLTEFSGFMRFALLRGDEQGDYISMSTWASREDFDNWRNSSAFQQAHGGSADQGQQKQSPREAMGEMLEGRPQPKFYEAVTVTEASLI